MATSLHHFIKKCFCIKRSRQKPIWKPHIRKPDIYHPNPDLQNIRFSNGRISDPHCIFVFRYSSATTVRRERKVKKTKLPGQPKRYASAYFIWMNESRESIKAKFPGLSVTDFGRKSGELWKEMTDKSVRLYLILLLFHLGYELNDKWGKQQFIFTFGNHEL